MTGSMTFEDAKLLALIVKVVSAQMKGNSVEATAPPA